LLSEPIVYAREIEPEVVQIEVIPTIPRELQRIADCESGKRNADGTAIAGSGRHTDDDGHVIVGKLNKPELGVDVGKYQINEYFHARRAHELGLDLYDEKDNEAYALRLYEEEGMEPWLASVNCWKE
jgi:hypothetical protein